MGAKIPVTVITGFLGSGKTTLIREQLQNNRGRRIAVLVNEFGEVGIDGELLQSCRVCDEEGKEVTPNIVELTNGCLCCTVQEEFLPTMQELAKRREQIDHILIETSGLALPKPLVQAFRWQEIRHSFTVDGVVTVVDGEALAQGKFVGDLAALQAQRDNDPSISHETPLEELLEDQLACADLVLMTKTDLIDRVQQQKVADWLKTELRPGVRVLPCQQGKIDPEIILGFNSAVEEDLANRPSHHDNDEDHEHDEDINSVYYESDRSFLPTEIVPKLKEINKQLEVYRIKGFVHVTSKPMRGVIQGVADRIELTYDRLWQEGEKRLTRLVFIGRNLTLGNIKTYLEA
ncbi:MAG: cobalamin biosynthesis protein CobW [Pseudanabaenaceae cyanobacterium SKYGB_i_bin29]|nr:cobalamin biosynthesis protein CobW [Pseudanabaenaceae cyanobacterium SKYG29]MDW8422585.1 cobalamin biosynthesis protein CobW [Pseudanabaenaceae cyanobacterium SKYGB_i_bin29]